MRNKIERNILMKKLFALLLVLSLLLVGCGGSEPISSKIVSVEITSSDTTAATEPAPTEKPLSFGQIEGGTYINTYAGIGCQLNENWSFYSAEELQELPEMVNGLIEGSDAAEIVDQYPQIFDLQAENVNDLLAVNVVYTKIGMQERLTYAVLSEEETIDATLENKDMMIQSYTQAGMEVESIEKVKLTFLGEEHWGIRTVAYTQGIPIYMLQVMNFKLGAYGMNLTATSYLEDNVQSVLDLFYVVE